MQTRASANGAALAPFSLSVGLMLPHPPYVARREDYDAYRGRMTLPKKPLSFAQVNHPFLRAWRTHTHIEDVPDDEILRARAAYWGLVQRVDRLVGEILDALAANDLAENTLIIYSSDHGDMQGEHGLWWKHVFYEESVKVPLILTWPGVIEGGLILGWLIMMTERVLLKSQGKPLTIMFALGLATWTFRGFRGVNFADLWALLIGFVALTAIVIATRPFCAKSEGQV